MNPTGEVRITSKTGGQKGTKPQRPGLVPGDVFLEFSQIYAIGAKKYDDNNWRKGYDWSLSIDAALRHLEQFNAGEDYDWCKCPSRPDDLPPTEFEYPCEGCGATGQKHILQAAWHCFTLAWYMDHKREFDNRAIRFDEQDDVFSPFVQDYPTQVDSLEEEWTRNFVWLNYDRTFHVAWNPCKGIPGWGVNAVGNHMSPNSWVPADTWFLRGHNPYTRITS